MLQRNQHQTHTACLKSPPQGANFCGIRDWLNEPYIPGLVEAFLVAKRPCIILHIYIYTLCWIFIHGWYCEIDDDVHDDAWMPALAPRPPPPLWLIRALTHLSNLWWLLVILVPKALFFLFYLAPSLLYSTSLYFGKVSTKSPYCRRMGKGQKSFDRKRWQEKNNCKAKNTCTCVDSPQYAFYIKCDQTDCCVAICRCVENP